MASNEAALVFESFTEADIPDLTRVMTRAFDDDAQKHLGQERGTRGALRMSSKTQSVANQGPPSAPSYFNLQATWGVTKHFGGTDTTDALAALCHIDRDEYVLDVGCGTGMTPCYLAETLGCRVVGIDIMEERDARAKEERPLYPYSCRTF